MTVGADGLALRRFEQAAATGDAQAGRRLVLEQLDRGVTGDEVVRSVLVPTQQAAGLRWQRAQWSVADEHAATAVVDAALGVVEQDGQPTETGGPRLVVVCAESEWHSMPARLAAQLAREAGARVQFLGPSIPSAHLREYLARLQPDAVAVSATLPTALPGAARSIAAARSVGVPVLVGGAAFGADDRRGRILHANGWLRDASGLASLPLRHWRDDLVARPQWETYHAVEAQAATAVPAAYAQLLEDLPRLRTSSAEQHARTREDLRHILDFLAASLLVDDVRVLQDFTAWLCEVLAVRGVSRTAVRASYDALVSQLEPRPAAVLRSMHEVLEAAA